MQECICLLYWNCRGVRTGQTAGTRRGRKSEVTEQMTRKKVADEREVTAYLTSVMRGQTESEVLSRTSKGAEIVLKHPEEKERLKAAELLGKHYAMFQMGVNVQSDCKLDILMDYGEDGG